MTTSFVIDETATRLRYDLGLRNALLFRDAILEEERTRRLRVVWVDRQLTNAAWEVLARYADVRLSFTDAVTIAVARAHRIREVFGFDEDFEAAGLEVAPGP